MLVELNHLLHDVVLLILNSYDRGIDVGVQEYDRRLDVFLIGYRWGRSLLFVEWNLLYWEKRAFEVLKRDFFYRKDPGKLFIFLALLLRLCLFLHCLLLLLRLLFKLELLLLQLPSLLGLDVAFKVVFKSIVIRSFPWFHRL